MAQYRHYIKWLNIKRLNIRWLMPVLACLFLWLAITNHAQARGFIRDAEIERLLRDYAEPVLIAGGLNPDEVGIALIDNRRLNAFVAGGQNIFFHTGLILEADTPNMVIGVIAHEAGHIIGGHLARQREAIEASNRAMLLAAILGIGALAAGESDAGLALITGGQKIALQSFLSYNRGQEAAADQTALQLLRLTKQSPQGLRDLMDGLADQEILSEIRQDPYVRSHPISRDRVFTYEEGLRNSPYANVKDEAALVRRHKMAQAKIYGFLDHPRNTLRRYGGKNDTPALYATAIAFHKQNELTRSLAVIDELLTRQPRNPYFHELKGQVLFEAGRYEQAIQAYRPAVAFAPYEPLIMTGLATAMVAAEQEPYTKEAVQILQRALKLDAQNTTAYYQLARAYGLQGNQAMAELATAERYFIFGLSQQAAMHAVRAEKRLKKGSPPWLRARDIVLAGQAQAKKKKERR